MKYFLLALFVCCVAAAGQWEDITADDEKFGEVVEYAAKHLNGRLRSPYHHKVSDIVRVQQQVVAGMQYKVTLKVVETDCKKTDVSFEEAKECDVRPGTVTKLCTVTIWEKAWEKDEKKRKRVTFTCTSNIQD